MFILYVIKRERRKLFIITKNDSKNTGKKPTEKHHTRTLTVTLILLVLMYIILVSPSEIYHFLMSSKFSKGVSYTPIFNLLQTINFSYSFLLYISVNGRFRKMLLTSIRNCFKIRASKRYREQPMHLFNERLLQFQRDNRRRVIKIRRIGRKQYVYSWSSSDNY